MDERILDYGPGPSKQTRLHHRLIQIILLLGALGSGYFLIPPCYRWMEILYWQHQAMIYSFPLNHIAVAIRITELNDAPVEILHSSGSPSSLPPLPDWKLSRVYSEPNHAIEFQLLQGSGPVYFLPSVFLHELHQPDGTPWLCAIFFEVKYPYGSYRQPDFVVELWRPFTFGSHDTTTAKSGYLTPITVPFGTKQFKVYGGQVDLKNPSHFTIDYEMDGARNTIDGWLDNSANILMVTSPQTANTLTASRP